MDRRAFVTGLGAVLAASLAAEAQHMGNAWRGTGWLGTTKWARWALPWGRNRSIGGIPD
jgi:hypothetical protein